MRSKAFLDAAWNVEATAAPKLEEILNVLWSQSVLTAVAELRGGAALEAAAHLRDLEGPWAAERLTQVEKKAFVLRFPGR